jgi:hypothetical protein
MALREPLLWQFSRGDDEATIAIDATPAASGRPRRHRPVGLPHRTLPPTQGDKFC